MSVKFEPPFLIVKSSGPVVLVESIQDLLKNIYVGQRKLTSPSWMFGYYEKCLCHDGEFVKVIYDLYGREIRMADIPWPKRPYYDPFWDKNYKKGFPVPFTGKRRRGRPNYFRRPKHHAAYKEFAISKVDAKEDDFLKMKAVHLPPQSWDDIMASDRSIKNWKQSRKHQWKSK